MINKIYFYDYNLFLIFQKGEKATTDGGTGESELKESNPVEKAEKDFWKIIEEEKRKRDRKTVLGDEKAAAEASAMAQADVNANATANMVE
jgi:hypothetical protein